MRVWSEYRDARDCCGVSRIESVIVETICVSTEPPGLDRRSEKREMVCRSLAMYSRNCGSSNLN